ncbi:hypothetical protein SODALDRAFT_329525 [Sodiomyces alkalinus F11]|uniref:Uncharacterized protein n=1 Tax=Sodiomyces alkalinus (strain CBS 110278 / VKM F-3762 / F11) TaxID=1314773 RepID=A0A3N2PJF5_SODAK|nr:hypothetical protein SODALDRAFT_329525 [Sodiomyces alkalinus F11]ROT34661.1 hypothetical protein SODALDRAFT_329525 [Sodiomyces alkalinus F11]
MPFTTTITVFLGLLAAVEGSSGGTARSQAGSSLGLARAWDEAPLAGIDPNTHHNSIENDVLRRLHSDDRPIHSGRLVTRAEISVSEADFLQLIGDVEDIRDRLFEMLNTGRAPGAGSSEGPDVGSPPTDDQNLPGGGWPQLDDPPRDGLTATAEETPASSPPPPSQTSSAQDLTVLLPSVSPTPTPQLLTTTMPDPPGPIEAEPTSSIGAVTVTAVTVPTGDPFDNDTDGDEFGEELTTVVATMTSDIDCTATITHTFTEFLYNGPSTLATSLRVLSESFDGDGDGASSTESVAVTEFPEDDNLVPFDFGDEREPGRPIASSTALEDLWEAAAPTITEPPPTSSETTDLLGDQVQSVEELPEPSGSQESPPALDQDGNGPPEETPSLMTLRLPGEGSTSIVWRTISLPVPQNQNRVAW